MVIKTPIYKMPPKGDPYIPIPRFPRTGGWTGLHKPKKSWFVRTIEKNKYKKYPWPDDDKREETLDEILGL
jgi:hypothetical protein